MEAFVVPPGAGESMRGPAGGPLEFKARAATTGGAVTAFENVVAPGAGPVLHRHRAEDEMYYVLDGALHFATGERRFDAPLGSFVFIPRGVPHAFRNLGSAPARILVLFTPAGMESFFTAHAALPAGPPDPAVLAEIAREAGMDVLGPPLAVVPG